MRAQEIKVGDICVCQKRSVGLVTEIKEFADGHVYIGKTLSTDPKLFGAQWESTAPRKVISLDQALATQLTR